MSIWQAPLSPAPLHDETVWRPLAHVAVRDEELRARIMVALRDAGWAVIGCPSGYHLLQSIAGPLCGNASWWSAELVVVDTFSPGCSGITIARGLRDLGWTIPTVLIVQSAEHQARVTDAPEDAIYVAHRDVAVPTILEVARYHLRRDVDGQTDSQTAQRSRNDGERGEERDRDREPNQESLQ